MENLCMNCMENIDKNQDICPYCSQPCDYSQTSPFLPKRTLLANRYVIGKGLEIDGEGLSYIGYDKVKKSKVYIREFFPSNFCMRGSDFTKIKILSNSEKYFKSSLIRFLEYFRSVARLRNLPAIISVYDIFEENNTAYIIFEWIEGTRLDKYLSTQGGYLEWDKAKLLFMPLISSLSHMEASGVKHLGISPTNILVTSENKLKLTGFATKNLRSANSLINSQLYDGCSALEQYLDDYESSESTDVYGLSASLFLSLTGEYPPSAPERKQRDKLMMPQNILNQLPENVVSAIANALRVYPNNRTLSFETLRIELSNSPLLRVQDIEAQDFNLSHDYSEIKNSRKSSGTIWRVISCVFALILLLSGLGIYWFWLRENSSSQKPSPQTTTFVPETEEKAEPQYQKTDKELLPVPNLSGKNLKTLQEEPKSNSQYRLVLLSEEFHDSIEEGCIISQVPNPGEEMEKNSTIAVNISKGSKKRILPEIKGKTLSEASGLITNIKLIPTSTNDFSNEYPEGIVIGYKNYNAGDSLDYGSEVVITVSKGAL